MKKNTSIAMVLLITFLLVVVLFALVSCGGNAALAAAIPKLGPNEMAIVIKNRVGDYTSYTVNLTKVSDSNDIRCDAVLAYLRDEEGLALEWADTAYGKYIYELGSITIDETKNEFIRIFTSNEEFQSIWPGSTYKIDNDVKLKGTWGGISQLGVVAGDIVYFELAIKEK